MLLQQSTFLVFALKRRKAIMFAIGGGVCLCSLLDKACTRFLDCVVLRKIVFEAHFLLSSECLQAASLGAEQNCSHLYP